MNITPSMIYWLTRLDEFSFMFGIVFVCIVIVALMNVIGGFYALDSASNDQLYNRPERLAENKHNIVVAEMGDTAKELVCLAKSWLIELKPQPKTENKEVKK